MGLGAMSVIGTYATSPSNFIVTAQGGLVMVFWAMPKSEEQLVVERLRFFDKLNAVIETALGAYGSK